PLLEVIKDISIDMKAIGLGFSPEGKIAVGEEFDKALNQNIAEVRDALTGEEGFLTKISTALEDILRNGAGGYLKSSSAHYIDTLV
ncbi:MAG: hypothetical protein NTY64_20960, partial [Deltaproteobacteria bacterium]|nr:hypothetical protein [Deltaproteobacteria bacterium]